jgi:hypothetical protein
VKQNISQMSYAKKWKQQEREREGEGRNDRRIEKNT